MGSSSDKDLFLINQSSLRKDSLQKDVNTAVAGTGRISDLPSTIPSIDNLPENTQMEYQWFWDWGSGGWNSRETYNGVAQEYVYTGALIKEDLASYRDIAALLGRELYNCGEEVVFTYTNVEVPKARSVRKECILAGVYANYKDGANALYLIVYLVKEDCYNVLKICGNGYVWVGDNIKELIEALEIGRKNDVRNNQLPYRDNGFRFEWEDGFAVAKYLKYYLRVCDAEKGPLVFIKKGGYVWK